MNEIIARTMTGQITARIREKILAGDYAPGTQLLQDSIAAHFGVSKIPVREALVQLKAEGLVDIFAHRGFQVRPVSAAEVDEVFNLRLAIEPEAVVKGAKLAGDEDRQSAKAVLTALNNSLTAGNLSQSGDLNSAFHLALIVPREQPVAAEVLHRLHTIAQRYVRMHLSPSGRVARANREHSAIFQAWYNGKVREARDRSLAHIAETRAELAAALLQK
jgi:DNA-binding GntR family transcriptional regulator